jgi:hypothetical protein
MSDNSFDKNFVTTSKFYLLRCLIAMAHADGVLHAEERGYIMAFVNHLPLTPEERRILDGDLYQPKSIEQFLPYIKEPSFYSQICYFARLMAFKDGKLTPDEEDLLEKVKAYKAKGVDIDALKQEAKAIAREELNLHEIEIDNLRPQKYGHSISWFQMQDELLLDHQIDLLRD